MMLGNCCRREPYVDTRPWYKKLWIHVTMRMRWNWPITRHLYQHVWLRYFSRQWRKIAMPVIKNTFPTFDAKEFVNVQPMTEVPPGVVFPMDFVYTEKKKQAYKFLK